MKHNFDEHTGNDTAFWILVVLLTATAIITIGELTGLVDGFIGL